MIETFKKALILAPHTDDGEFGCGGTISKLIHLGCEVHYIAFSVCEQAVPYGFSQNELEKELYQATDSLRIPKENVYALRYPVRKFPEYRQDILQDIIDYKF